MKDEKSILLHLKENEIEKEKSLAPKKRMK